MLIFFLMQQNLFLADTKTVLVECFMLVELNVNISKFVQYMRLKIKNVQLVEINPIRQSTSF